MTVPLTDCRAGPAGVQPEQLQPMTMPPTQTARGIEPKVAEDQEREFKLLKNIGIMHLVASARRHRIEGV
ncbi:MAG: hypothetical protein KDA51_17120, partial [Planctomycetales bacterium]|nr:hypothetical protein [Planctomycetales bacterium]